MRIAIEGCCHGALDKIYETVVKVGERSGVKVDLLICCGDFQAVRNTADLTCMAVPIKYRKMETFYKYYSGEKVAPVMTIFVGGNHEATNHLWELSYGGWVAPNIYYLGNAGVVRFGGLRIAGISGIYKGRDYTKGHYECPPYSEETKRSAYHVRSCDVFRLKQLSGHLDVFVSHDWPLGIYYHGNTDELIRTKPYFAEEIASESLGSPPLMELLRHLKPALWFAAHLHVKFAAVYQHEAGGEEEGGGRGEEEDREGKGRLTKFLALDKCLPRRKFLQILDIPSPSGLPYRLEYDPEWLAIVMATELHMQYTRTMWLPPNPLTDKRHIFTPSPEELEEISRRFAGDLSVPDNFSPTATVYDPTQTSRHPDELQAFENPQTLQLCQKLGIRNPFRPKHTSGPAPQPLFATPPHNPDEIPLDSDDESNGTGPTPGPRLPPSRPEGKPRYPWLDDCSGEGQETSPIHTTDVAAFHTSMESGPVTNPEEIPLPASDGSDSEEARYGLGASTDRKPLLLPTPSSDPNEVVMMGEGGVIVGGGEEVMVGSGEGGMVVGEEVTKGGGEGETVGGGEVAMAVGEGEMVQGSNGGKKPQIKRRNIALYERSCDDEDC